MPESNISNRTIFYKDNLDVMRGINSNCIDLIDLDPPFNKNKKFTAPIGNGAEGAEFSDIFTEEDVKAEWLVAMREDQPKLCHYLKSSSQSNRINQRNSGLTRDGHLSI